jgi:hypothetical protein
VRYLRGLGANIATDLFDKKYLQFAERMRGDLVLTFDAHPPGQANSTQFNKKSHRRAFFAQGVEC